MDLFTSELSGTTTEEELRAMKIYGEILKRRRKERGITMTEFSERTGMSREDIEAAERGALILPSAKKRRIEKFLRRQKIL